METTKEEALISVIMPACNSEKHICDAIASVLHQTYTCLELIIIDDGSIDKTADIVSCITKEDSRVSIIRNKKNMGVSYSRNLGIAKSKGTWIAFLDSDDIWDINKLEKQMSYAIETSSSFLFTGSNFISESGVLMRSVFHVPEKIDQKELLKQNVISCSSVLIKKELILGYMMPESSFHEDFALWLQILKNEPFAYGLDKPLLYYRISDKSKSRNKINAAKMTWNVYRYIGLNPLYAAYYWIHYVARSLKKYWKLRRKVV